MKKISIIIAFSAAVALSASDDAASASACGGDICRVCQQITDDSLRTECVAAAQKIKNALKDIRAALEEAPPNTDKIWAALRRGEREGALSNPNKTGCEK